jgi:hypothetical protein
MRKARAGEMFAAQHAGNFGYTCFARHSAHIALSSACLGCFSDHKMMVGAGSHLR